MKIAFLCPEFPPDLWGPFHGGITTYAINMVNGYQGLGHEVHVFTSGRKTCREVHETGATIHRLRVSQRSRFGKVGQVQAFIANEIACWKAVSHEAAKGRFNLMEVIDWGTPAWLTTKLVKADTTVVKLHGPSDFLKHLNKVGTITPLARLGARRERDIAINADILLTAADVLREEMQKIWKFNREIVLLPDPVSDPVATTAVTSLSGNRIILSVGRLEERKGQKYLVEALNGLVTFDEDWQVVFVGPDTLTGPQHTSYKTYMEKSASPPVRERMRFIDTVPHDDLYEWYRQAYLVVVCSLDGNYGYTSLEAMSAGATAVTTSQPGGHDSGYVKHRSNGWLVPPGDAVPLTEALIALLNNPSLAKTLGVAAERHIQEQYSPATIAAKLLTLAQEKHG